MQDGLWDAGMKRRGILEGSFRGPKVAGPLNSKNALAFFSSSRSYDLSDLSQVSDPSRVFDLSRVTDLSQGFDP